MPTRFAGWSATSAKTRPGTRRARVDIALTDLGYDVVLTIDDDGRGIPESERERVLRRFVRLNEARSRDDAGSGVEAHDVKSIAAQDFKGFARVLCFFADQGLLVVPFPPPTRIEYRPVVEERRQKHNADAWQYASQPNHGLFRFHHTSSLAIQGPKTPQSSTL